MKEVSLVLFYAFFLISAKGYCQFTKFYDEISSQEIHLNENNEIILSTGNGYFSKLKSTGDILWTKKLYNNTTKRLFGTQPDNMLITEDCEFTRFRALYGLTRENSYVISFLDGIGQVQWTKSVQLDFDANQINQRYVATSLMMQNQMLVCGNFFNHELDEDVLSILSLSLNGEFLGHKSFIRKDHSNLNLTTTTFHKLSENLLAVLSTNTEDNLEEQSEIVLFNAEMEYQNSFKVPMTIQKVFYENDNFFLLGYKDENRSSKLMCLNSNLEIVWTLVLKKFVFEFMSSRFGKVKDGFIIKTRVPAERSEIISWVSNSGELISSYRIPRKYFVQYFPLATNSTSLAYYSRAETLHENPFTNLLSYYNVEFDNLQCYIPQTCMETDTFSLNLFNIDNPYTSIKTHILVKDTSFSTMDMSIVSDDICSDNFGIAAVPLFSSDDTLCVGEIVPLYNLQNANAQSIYWELGGSTLESSVEEEPTFSYSESGKYTITQIVEYTNCSSEYSVDIVVVSPANTEFVVDQVLCEPKNYLFDVSTEDASSYLWLADSSTLPTFLASTPGSYDVQITDGHCVQNQTMSLSYFDYNLIKVNLGNDTTICMQKPIPISLAFDSLVSFSWSDFEPDLNRELAKSGSYTLTTSLGECSTRNTINIIAEDCSTQIYIPNAFSPNSDGINDLFFPSGNFFEILEFKIFDRWGNQLYDKPNSWDGTFRGQVVPLGVYSYSLIIENNIVDEIELFKGDVVVVK